LPDLVGSWTRIPSIAVSARRHKIPILATRDLNDAVGCRFISDLRPDLLLSAFFNQRIGKAVCAIPTAGAVNIHPSLLPDFRGVDPVFHTRLQGSLRFGVTVHRITAEFDAGPVLVQDEVAIDSHKSLLAATWMLFEQGAGCFLAQLPAILRGVAGQVQKPGGSYDSWPTSQQVAAFKRGGARLVRFADWRLFFGPERDR
jgi:methionyl-tRNA formyltransferase